MTHASEQQGAMKVRKYFAADMRSALEMVRAQQGPDVLILSNRQLDDGIELITADDSVNEQVLRSLKARTEKSNDIASDRNTRGPSVKQIKKRRPEATRAQADPRRTAGPRKSVGNDFSDALDMNGERYAKTADRAGHEDLLWTDENTVQQMQMEMRKIKTLLEQQLSGLAWSDFGHKYPQRARLLRTLTRMGITPDLAKCLVQQVSPDLDMDKAWQFVVALLTKNLRVLPDPIISKGGQVAICGPTGVGKTTLVCKLAARYAQQHGTDKVTIVSLDDHRLGAHQQLKVFARLSGVECLMPANDEEFRAALARHSNDDGPYLTLIDTSGFAPDDIRFRESIARLSAVDIYFAIAATTDYASLAKVVNLSSEVNIAGCLLTKLDEAAQLGGALSALVKAKLPLAYVSNGQTVPDDLEVVDAKRLISQAVAMAALEGTPSNDFSIESAFAQTSKG